MKGYVQNLEAQALDNTDFRRVIYTAVNCQLVLMSLPAMGDIGMEVHKLDQFFRIEDGVGEAILDGVHSPIGPGSGVLVPAGTQHNIVNTGSDPLKLYTIYSPPNHRDGVVHKTRADAEKDKEHFDGKTSEGKTGEGKTGEGKTSGGKTSESQTRTTPQIRAAIPPATLRSRLSFNFAAPRVSLSRFVQG